jgi:hypothetical protein
VSGYTTGRREGYVAGVAVGRQQVLDELKSKTPLLSQITAQQRQIVNITKQLADLLTLLAAELEKQELRITRSDDDNPTITALRNVLVDRERELLKAKGPCSNRVCNLHASHSGPCADAHVYVVDDGDSSDKDTPVEHNNEGGCPCLT